eukprot:s158_g43.t1
MLKQTALWVKANECRTSRVPTGYFMESPDNPKDYLDGEEAEISPSFFNFKEVRQFLGTEGITYFAFDQGQTGHRRRKPTGAVTNLPDLSQLAGLRGGGVTAAIQGGLGERIMASTKSWAEWSPGLVAALKESLKMYLQVVEADSAEMSSDPHLQKLDMAAWRRHVRQQHVPFRKDCRFCLESMGMSQPHRRSNNASSAFTMSVNVMGPYCTGKDLGTGKSCRYAMVAVVPVSVVSGAAEIPEVKGEVLAEGVPELPELEEEVELAPQEQVQAMNEKADIDRFAVPMEVPPAPEPNLWKMVIAEGDAALEKEGAKDQHVVGRYKDLAPKSVPLPASLEETPEENFQLADVRAAQTVVGELLWAACRTRPDLSYSVAWLGRNVMRCPKLVLMYAKHTLGYIPQTADVCLSYTQDSGGYGKNDQLSFQRTMRTVEIFSDAALGPEGKRGHQGLIAAYGGAPVQWDSRLQPFCVVSTTSAMGWCLVNQFLRSFRSWRTMSSWTACCTVIPCQALGEHGISDSDPMCYVNGFDGDCGRLGIYQEVQKVGGSKKLNSTSGSCSGMSAEKITGAVAAIGSPTFGLMPWTAPEFNQPPRAAQDDIWIQITGGWAVKVHRSLRTNRFLQTQDLEPRRSRARGWERSIQEDQWGSGQIAPWAPVLQNQTKWAKTPAARPRLLPDTIEWRPTEEQGAAAWNLPRQYGRSSGANRRGQVDAAERGATAFAGMLPHPLESPSPPPPPVVGFHVSMQCM